MLVHNVLRRASLIGFAGLCAVALVATAEERPTNELPTFEDGQSKGMHAVYRHANFIATMDKKGVLAVQPMDKGKAVGVPFVFFQLSPYYVDPAKRGHQNRPVASFDKPGKPTEQPRAVLLKGLLADDVAFEVEYEFSGNTITVSGGCADPRRIEFPTQFRLSTSFRQSHDIQPQVEQEDREALLKDCVLVTKETMGKRATTFEYPYYNTMRFSGALEDVEVRGAYAPRVVRIQPARTVEGRMVGSIYTNNCPWQGFGVYYHTPDAARINRLRNKITLTID